MELKDKIKQARQKKNLTQKELAELTGLTQTTVAKLETGLTKKPNIDVAIKISDALKVDIYYLFGDGSIKNPVNSESEKDKLKILVFHSLDKYISNQIFFRSTEYDENNPEHQKKFEEYKNHLKEFRKGMYETLVNVGFCTHEDIRAYRAYINPNKKK
jgi:transcriptional regulator with XRE-family HTH domain